MIGSRFLKSNEEVAYVVLRIVSGALLTFHGAQKILGFYATVRPAFPTQLWFGGVIELVGGLLVAIGAFTRCAAFIVSGTMAVAYFQFHWKLQGGAQFFPAINKGELAVVYCFVFLFIACRGAERFSVDAARGKG